MTATTSRAHPPQSAGADGEGVKPPLGSFPGGMGLTARQAELLRFIGAYLLARGYSPCFAEMRDALRYHGESVARISQLLADLERKGYIRRLRKRARAIEVLRPAPEPTIYQVPGPFAALIRAYRALPEKPAVCVEPHPFTGHRTCADWMQAEAA